MESILSLGNLSLFPILTPYTSAFTSLRTTKLRFHLNYRTSPSLCIGNDSLPFRKVSISKIRAQDGSSSIPDRNNSEKIVRNTAGVSVAMACVFGMIGLNLKMNQKAIAGPREKFQKAPQVVSGAIGYPLGGQFALKSLLEANVYLASGKTMPRPPPSRLPARPSKEDVDEIKKSAMWLIKIGKPEDAVGLLEKAYKLYEHDSEPAYNVGMALIEILICQGKYMEASQYCDCFGDEQLLPSDGRLPLYKAIVCTMLDQKEEAKKWWEKYLEMVDAEQFDPRNL